MVDLDEILCSLTIYEQFALKYLRHLLLLRIPDFHHEIYTLLEERRLAVSAPRSFAKSTITSIIKPICDAVLGRKKEILLISATGALAEEWMGKIRREFETNLDLRRDFGDMTTSKWTIDHITVQRKGCTPCNIRAKGAGYQIMGFRPDLVEVDDLENEEEVLSEDQRDKKRYWFDTALLGTLEPSSQLVMVGTQLHPYSLLTRIIDSTDDEDKRRYANWTKRKYKAFGSDGHSIWVEKWTDDDLNLKRQEIGEIAFASQYMNEPQIWKDTILHKDWFKFTKEIPKDLLCITACDPAISMKDKACDTAIVTWGLSSQDKTLNNIYVVDCDMTHIPFLDQAKIMIEHYKLHNSRYIVIESVAFQAGLGDLVIEEGKKQRIPLEKVVLMVHPDKDKRRRLEAVSPLFQKGQVYFPEETHKFDRLREQLGLFTGRAGERTDGVDATSLCLSQLEKHFMRRTVHRYVPPRPILIPDPISGRLK